MADTRAISAIAETVVRLLETSAEAVDFSPLEFRVFTSQDFAQPITNGVSLFVYRVLVNGTNRSPRGRIDAAGQRLKPSLPLDVHFLLTVWGGEPSLQHELAAWMMRVMEDHPVLTASVLNAVTAEVFRAEESIELSVMELSNEDLLRIWEVLNLNVYQLSVPYVARVVSIESIQLQRERGGGPVQDRTAEFGIVEPPEART